MEAQILSGHVYEQLGILLEYPTDDDFVSLKSVIDTVKPIFKEAAGYLEDFYSRMRRMDLNQRQEFYVQSFDVMPKCSLYLSIYLFGEESFKRPELMTGLINVYERHGAFTLTELPDHLAAVLKRSRLFKEDEWSELVEMCVLPALAKMIKGLEKNHNPYANILKAIQVFMTETERSHV